MNSYFVKVYEANNVLKEVHHFHTEAKLWEFLQGVNKSDRFAVYKAECVMDMS